MIVNMFIGFIAKETEVAQVSDVIQVKADSNRRSGLFPVG